MKFKVYESVWKERREWRWMLVARNGRIVADSGEGYTSKLGCQRAVRTVIEGVRKIK